MKASFAKVWSLTSTQRMPFGTNWNADCTTGLFAKHRCPNLTNVRYAEWADCHSHVSKSSTKSSQGGMRWNLERDVQKEHVGLGFRCRQTYGWVFFFHMDDLNRYWITKYLFSKKHCWNIDISPNKKLGKILKSAFYYAKNCDNNQYYVSVYTFFSNITMVTSR